MPTFRRHTGNGFTLIELLLVLGIMGILSAIVFLALNPQKQLGLARNRERHNAITSILDAVYQYQIDNSRLPPGIPIGAALPICKDTAATCTNGIDLRILTLSGTYLVHLPADPQTPESGTGTNYYIMQDTDRRITITAPGAEQEEVISVKR